jgi:hypothetical protein
VHPQHLARRGIERDDGAARAGGRIDHPVDHQRRGLEVELGLRPHGVGLEAPGDLQLVEVVTVDLFEGPVAATGVIAPVGRPLVAGRSARPLSDEGVVHRGQNDDYREEGRDKHAGVAASSVLAVRSRSSDRRLANLTGCCSMSLAGRKQDRGLMARVDAAEVS